VVHGESSKTLRMIGIAVAVNSEHLDIVMTANEPNS